MTLFIIYTTILPTNVIIRSTILNHKVQQRQYILYKGCIIKIEVNLDNKSLPICRAHSIEVPVPVESPSAK